MKALIIIPAYNEARSIPALIGAIRKQTFPVPYDILVIDDGSRDNTTQAARDGGARCVTLIENLGYGRALRAGYEFARAHAYDTVVQLDGDGQHDPASAPALVEALLAGDCDLVIGSRYNSGSTYEMPLARRVGQRLFSTALKWMGGVTIRDVTSGFQIVGPKAFRLCLSDEFPSDFPDANALLFLTLHGIRIKEIPASFRKNEAGTSMHGGFWRPMYYIYGMLFSMLIVFARYRRLRTGLSDL